MNLQRITVEELARRLPKASVYGADFLVADRLEGLDPLGEPVRMEAMGAFICVSGSATATINLKSYRIEPGSVVVVVPGDTVAVTEVGNADGYVVVASPDCMNELDLNFSERSNFFLRVRRSAMARVPRKVLELLLPYDNLLRYAIVAPEQHRPRILRGMLTAFCFSIITLMERYGESMETAGEHTSRDNQIFNSFISMLGHHHLRERSVGFYARQLGLSPNYLSAAVKNFTGKGALQWINQYVILEARLMLRNTSASVKQIAYELNFASQSSFGKYFKMHTGMGPRQYRATLGRRADDSDFDLDKFPTAPGE